MSIRLHNRALRFSQALLVVLAAGAAALAQTPAPPSAKPTPPRTEWANVARYRDANAKIGPPAPGENRVVFMGDSITDGWDIGGAYFAGKPYVNRGISGQTTPQMLVRFRPDVIALKPKVVVVLAGINDIAGNTGPTTLESIEGNLEAMATMARRNGIRVVMASVTPAFDFPWKSGLQPAEKIRTLNRWIRGFASKNRMVYLDYHTALVDERGGMKAVYTTDGVHPNAAGYAVMAPLAQKAIEKALAQPAPKKEAKALDVAAIYFPSYQVDDHYSTWFGENWNEWKLVEPAKPRFPGHKLNKPAWGYYDEADPKVMERQIDAATKNGIDVFIFDWYWYSGAQILHRPVEEALPKARNRNQMKYALMWANHTWTNVFPAPYNKPYHWLLPIRHSPEDFDRVMDHCIRVHFKQPNYWRVNGGLYFSLFAPEDFIQQLGGPEKAKAVMEAARQKVRKAGLGEMHFAAFTGIPESAKLCEDAGFDSLTSYNVTTMSAPLRLPEQPFEEYEAFAQRHLPYWDAMEKSSLPYCPIVTAGWDVSFRWSDDTPWPPAVNNYPYTPIVVNNTPEKFEALCREARGWVERNPKEPFAVFVNSWNEWTEGGAIMPGTEHGDGYLKAVKEAFRD